MTILVSGASGVVGYGILKSLGASKNKYRLIGTTIYDNSVASKFCDAVEKLLPTDDPYYIHNFLEIIQKHKVDMIIPSIECDVYKWTNWRNLFLNTEVFPMLNNHNLINLCYDKWYFYETLKAKNPQYAIPTVLIKEYNPFSIMPYLLKPRHGYGSKGIVKVEKPDDFNYHRENIGEQLMSQMIIGTADDEYTVSGFFDKESRLVDYFPLKRKLSSSGFTEQAEIADRNFGEVLRELAETFKPIGPTNFQFRMDKDQPKLLEINPRISSATSIRTLFGYNEAEMSVEYFLHGTLPEPKDKSGIMGRKAIRYMEDYIL